MTSAVSDSAPEYFRQAIDSLTHSRIRHEIEIESITPPQKLAPHSYALGATIYQSALDPTSDNDFVNTYGRMIFLYDPAGQESWEGTLRLVIYIESELDPDMAGDPLLPQVGWSWLTDALENHSPDFTALGGTVTTTASYRQGDLLGPEHTFKIEIRSSWTATTPQLNKHLEAFCEVLELAAGLPPEGIVTISAR